MKVFTNLKIWLCAFAVLFLITACGGGSSEDSTGNNANDSTDILENTTPSGDEVADRPDEPSSNPPSTNADEALNKVFHVVQGNDLNTKNSPLLSLNPGGPGGSPNQSLRAGDILQGDTSDDVVIGGLGVDLLIGHGGDDILIGGTEDFNSSVDGDNLLADNRDRAIGGDGDDTFIWAPGDGSDFFDGGAGTDVIIFGILGESKDSNQNTDGAPFFAVNPPGSDGSQDFDGIFLNAADNSPIVRVSSGPGFCSVIDQATNATELDLLGLDKLVRFSLRNLANGFDSGAQTDDDGLRVAVSLKNTEYLVCTKREVVENGGSENIEVIDLRGDVATLATIDELPVYVRSLLQ